MDQKTASQFGWLFCVVITGKSSSFSMRTIFHHILFLTHRIGSDLDGRTNLYSAAPSVKTGNDQLIYLEDIAQITGDDSAVQKLSKMPIYHVSKRSSHRCVRYHACGQNDQKTWPDIDIQTVGGSEAIVEIDTGKRQLSPYYSCLYGSSYLSERPLPS